MNIENIISAFIACICLLGACIVIAIPALFIAYELRRFFAFLRRAYSRRRLNAIMGDLKPMDQMIHEYYGGVK